MSFTPCPKCSSAAVTDAHLPPDTAECERCGFIFVAPTAQVSDQRLEKQTTVVEPRKKRALFGGIAWSWLMVCIVAGTGAFSFLSASGNGWRHDALAPVHDVTCQLMGCKTPELNNMPQWKIEQFEVTSNGAGSILTAQLVALVRGAPEPMIQIKLSHDGQTLTRTFSPDQYAISDNPHQVTLMLEQDYSTVKTALSAVLMPPSQGTNWEIQLAEQP